MTNKEYLEYLQVCTQEDISGIYNNKYKAILNSSVSMKEYMEVYKLMNIPNRYKWDLLLNVYMYKVDVEKALHLLCNTIKIYYKYLYEDDCAVLIIYLLNTLNKMKDKISVLEQARKVSKVAKIDIYEFGVKHTYTIIQGHKVITLKSSLIRNIDCVGGILFKGGKGRVIGIEHLEVLNTQDYDLIILPK